MGLSREIKNSLVEYEKLQFLRALCRKDLSSFIRKSFDIVSPGTKYLHNWHVELISKYLEAVKDGDIKRLVINIPPRSLKSISVAVSFPAWILGHDPTKKIICSSYSQSLAIKHSLDTRTIIDNPFYKFLFPDIELVKDQNTKTKFMTTQRGYRFATSVGGSLTGEGADILIVDDPHKADQIYSPAFRESTKLWFDQAFMTRLNDRKKGAVIVVMQRLHEDDITGHLLNKKGWEHLRIPLIAEDDEEYKIKDFYYHRSKGELMHPDTIGNNEADQLKIDLGNFAFAGQYQQSPMAAGGNIIKTEWIKTYKELPNVKMLSWSWDTAIKVGQENDYSVGTLWAECEDGYYLIDLFRQKIEYPELKKVVSMLYNNQKSHEVLIEDKASGQQILQDFKRIGTMPVIAVSPGCDMPLSKPERMQLVSGLFAAGKVFIPENADWSFDFLKEMTQFPAGKHDDICDSVTQYLIRRLNRKNKAPNVRVL